VWETHGSGQASLKGRILVSVSLDRLSGRTYIRNLEMQFGGTVLYVEEVSPVVDFYRRAFGLELRFFDETLGFAELETGGSTLAIAAHSLGEMLMPNRYSRPADGRPAGIEIAFHTRDVLASFAKAIAEGATPITPPRRMPWGLEVAYVRAPEGTVIGFSEPPPPATK
jgi:lactoylglutathione lyase